MFVLRRITGEGHQVNECLGQSYHFIDKESNKEDFERTYEIYNGGSPEREECIHAFLTYDEGKEIKPLYRPSKYYIMTENGKTFANLTFK